MRPDPASVPAAPPAPTVPVWDAAVRVLHWALALAVVLTWVSGHWFDDRHHALGYAVGGIVLARVAWGFAGGRYARFSHFVRGPRATGRYALDVLAHREPRHLGHNPLGGWMVVALLACAAAAVLTGFLYTTDWLWGYGWLADLHAALSWALVALVALHLAGVAFTARRHRERLVAAMLHGRKPAAGPGDVDG